MEMPLMAKGAPESGVSTPVVEFMLYPEIVPSDEMLPFEKLIA